MIVAIIVVPLTTQCFALEWQGEIRARVIAEAHSSANDQIQHGNLLESLAGALIALQKISLAYIAECTL